MKSLLHSPVSVGATLYGGLTGFLGAVSLTLGGFDGTNFNVLGQSQPAVFLASFNGGADSLMGNIDFTKVLNANTNVSTLTGGYTVTQIMGDSPFVSNFGGVGGTGTFDWVLFNNIPFSFTTLAGLLTQTCVSGGLVLCDQAPFGRNQIGFNAAQSTGSITPAEAPNEIPLPPAIYLFGSVLGGAFWLGRRKRSAVSELGAA